MLRARGRQPVRSNEACSLETLHPRVPEAQRTVAKYAYLDVFVAQELLIYGNEFKKLFFASEASERGDVAGHSGDDSLDGIGPVELWLLPLEVVVHGWGGRCFVMRRRFSANILGRAMNRALF